MTTEIQKEIQEYLHNLFCYGNGDKEKWPEIITELLNINYSLDKINKISTTLTSLFAIKEKVFFKPMRRHQKKLGISNKERDGVIVAIRFTVAKVHYDIVDNYLGRLFKNIDSAHVYTEKRSIKPL